ncbi:hypothetical protein CMV_018171 [Castanea mollissima]|uniref:Uncharacterized protein n=1 Tax=Castanea mollissima TaxID=60419 RepID=A0A8J4R2W8_9ROSI|nr:hypothetical protein CMV_018171 [Castanea mollissima]
MEPWIDDEPQILHLGPLDESLLTQQRYHRSEDIWNGELFRAIGTFILDTVYGDFEKNLREGFDDEYVNSEDCSKFINYETLKNWKDEELIQSIRDRFVTGDWEKAKSRNKYPEANAEDDDDAVYGDFEDLEAGEKNERHRTDDTGNGAVQMENDPAAEERRLKKLALRAKFDAQYPFELFYFQYTFLCDPIATPSFFSLSFLGCS